MAKDVADGSINDLIAKFEENRKGRAESEKQQISRLNEVAKKIQDQTKTIDLQTQNDKETQSKLKSLQMSTAAGDPLIQQLNEDFKTSQAALQSAIESGDQKAIELAREQVEAAQNAIVSEEERREALAKQEESNSLLRGLGDKLTAGRDAAVATGGFLAGIAALALLFMDPETFANIVMKGIEALTTIFETFGYLIDGDMEGLKAHLDENKGLFAGILAGIGVFFAGPIMNAISFLSTKMTAFGTFLKSEFVANMVDNMKSMMASVGKALMNPITTLKNLFLSFQTTMVGQFLVQMTDNLKSMMASVGKALMNPITTLKNLFTAFKTSMAVTFVTDMAASLRSMMASVGRALMNPITTLRNLFTGFRVFMTATFIPGMIAAFTGMMASVGGMLAAMAPILIPILAIGAILGLIYLAFDSLKKAMGFTSIFDVIMLGVAHLKDAFAHVVNAIGSIVNFIFGIVEGIASFIGFDVELPKVPKMSTDNAEKKKAELDLKAEQARIEAAAEEERQKMAEAGQGTEILDTSTENAMTPAAPVTVVQNEQVATVQSSSNQNNNISVRHSGPHGRSDRMLNDYLAYAR